MPSKSAPARPGALPALPKDRAEMVAPTGTAPDPAVPAAVDPRRPSTYKIRDVTKRRFRQFVASRQATGDMTDIGMHADRALTEYLEKQERAAVGG